MTAPFFPFLLHPSVNLPILRALRGNSRSRANVATFLPKSGNLALPLLATSCRFCHPQRLISPHHSPQTPLNSAVTRETLPITLRKAAKTAMLTIPVNFAAAPHPGRDSARRYLAPASPFAWYAVLRVRRRRAWRAMPLRSIQRRPLAARLIRITPRINAGKRPVSACVPGSAQFWSVQRLCTVLRSRFRGRPSR